MQELEFFSNQKRSSWNWNALPKHRDCPQLQPFRSLLKTNFWKKLKRRQLSVILNICYFNILHCFCIYKNTHILQRGGSTCHHSCSHIDAAWKGLEDLLLKYLHRKQHLCATPHVCSCCTVFEWAVPSVRSPGLSTVLSGTSGPRFVK